ncbi:MAG: CheR family methyltransferase [Candidatus Nitrosoglobus sp.]|jgi:hypothetical protein
MVVFTRQKLISDPPFSRMDLISCCNLLIYFELSLQKMIMPVFHYALKPVGYLLLGASESIGEFTDLFEAVDKRYKIYVKKVASSVPIHLPLLHKEYGERSLPALLVVRGEAAESLRGELNAQLETDRIIINRFAPLGVLADDALQILQFRESTGTYLERLAIDDLVRSQQAIIYARDSAENTIEALPMPPLVLDSRLRVEHANRAFYHTFHVMAAETADRLVHLRSG